VVDSSKLRDLIASYRSQAKAPSLTIELKRYNEEMADYLEVVANKIDSARLASRSCQPEAPSPA
jgi:hypothetical protein